MVSRDYSGNTLSSQAANPTARSAQLSLARPTTTTSPLLMRSQKSFSRVPKAIMQAVANQGQQKTAPLKSPYDEASTPPQVQKPDSQAQKPDPVKPQSPDVSANLRGQASQIVQGDAQVANQTPIPNTNMPPTLKALVDFLNQQPDQALKVPANRLPEVESFLMQAGLPPAQVESLISSPNFSEQGLTAQNIQAAWQNAVKDSLQQTIGANGNQIAANLQQGPLQQTVASAAQVVSLQNIVNKPEYQQMWQSLTLPQQDLPALRAELQKLGVPPETLTDLNAQNYPQGISLAKVWQYLQQAPKSPVGSTDAISGDSLKAAKAADAIPIIGAGQDVAKWRQFLTDAGMDPELAKTMIPNPDPSTRGDLRTDLMQVAPPPATPQQTDAPKPLYLPGNLRVHQVPQLQQTTAGQGQGESSANDNLAQNFSFDAKQQEANIPVPTTANITENLNNFLAMLNGDSQVKSDQAAAPAVTGNPSAATAYLTPEAKEAIWTQVQSGILGNLRPGENQITLTLNPPDLGKITLTLNVRGETVEVTAVTSHAAVAEAATTGVQQLAQALTQQGLTLTHFNFHHQDEAPHGQTQLAFSQNQGGDPRQTGNTGNQDANTGKWDRPATTRQQRGNSGIDCFA